MSAIWKQIETSGASANHTSTPLPSPSIARHVASTSLLVCHSGAVVDSSELSEVEVHAARASTKMIEKRSLSLMGSWNPFSPAALNVPRGRRSEVMDRSSVHRLADPWSLMASPLGGSRVPLVEAGRTPGDTRRAISSDLPNVAPPSSMGDAGCGARSRLSLGRSSTLPVHRTRSH